VAKGAAIAYKYIRKAGVQIVNHANTVGFILLSLETGKSDIAVFLLPRAFAAILVNREKQHTQSIRHKEKMKNQF
jgi:hypothetical protein